MTGRERVEAALALSLHDRPPVGLWGHAFLEEWSADRLADVTIKSAKEFEWDFVKLQPRSTCFAEVFGSRYRPSGTRVDEPLLELAAVEESKDWERLEIVNQQVLPEQNEALARVSLKLGEETPVLQTVFSPLTVAGHLIGKDPARAVSELRYDPLLRGAMENITGVLEQFALEAIKSGASGIFFAISGYASSDYMTAEEYRELALPYDLRVMEAAGEGWFNVLHLCKEHLNFDLANSLPSHAVSWSVQSRGNPSLEEGLAKSGRAVMGGVDHNFTLVDGEAGRIHEEVRWATSVNSGRGVIVAPGCSVPPQASDAALHAVAAAARESGSGEEQV